MSSSRLEWILVAVCLLALARTGSGLRCWFCESNVNPMCGDPMNTTEHQGTFHTATCTSSGYETANPICRKIVKREYGQRVVIRQCSTPNSDERDITDGPCGAMATNGRTMIESCHICSTDLCNSATGAYPASLILGGVLALLGFRSL